MYSSSERRYLLEYLFVFAMAVSRTHSHQYSSELPGMTYTAGHPLCQLLGRLEMLPADEGSSVDSYVGRSARTARHIAYYCSCFTFLISADAENAHNWYFWD